MSANLGAPAGFVSHATRAHCWPEIQPGVWRIDVDVQANANADTDADMDTDTDGLTRTRLTWTRCCSADKCRNSSSRCDLCEWQTKRKII